MTTFTWKVAVNGHQWAAANDAASASLRAIDPWHTREYEPLESCTGLFRKFATTPATREGVVHFADRYGQLGIARQAAHDVAQPSESSDSESEDRNGEELGEWCRQITAMRECVECWEHRRSAHDKAMDRLNECVSKHLQGRVHVVFCRNRRVGGFILQMLPTNLLGALWLQLAQTISGNKSHHACAACGDWFEISPAMFRKSKIYCSDACRSRVYRDRKQKARTLAEAGTSWKQIAAELAVDVKSVKAWLKKK